MVDIPGIVGIPGWMVKSQYCCGEAVVVRQVASEAVVVRQVASVSSAFGCFFSCLEGRGGGLGGGGGCEVWTVCVCVCVCVV